MYIPRFRVYQFVYKVLVNSGISIDGCSVKRDLPYFEIFRSLNVAPGWKLDRVHLEMEPAVCSASVLYRPCIV